MYKHIFLYKNSFFINNSYYKKAADRERHRQNLPEAPFLPAAAFGMPPVFLFFKQNLNPEPSIRIQTGCYSFRPVKNMSR